MTAASNERFVYFRIPWAAPMELRRKRQSDIAAPACSMSVPFAAAARTSWVAAAARIQLAAAAAIDVNEVTPASLDYVPHMVMAARRQRFDMGSACHKQQRSVAVAAGACWPRTGRTRAPAHSNPTRAISTKPAKSTTFSTSKQRTPPAHRTVEHRPHTTNPHLRQ